MTALDRLVGTWQVSGEASGTVTYEWAQGGHFLLQHVDLDHAGHRVQGMEVIGHLQPFVGERSEHAHSRFYGGEGETYDYVYEGDADTLTIWGGEKDSPSYFRGRFATSSPSPACSSPVTSTAATHGSGPSPPPQPPSGSRSSSPTRPRL